MPVTRTTSKGAVRKTATRKQAKPASVDFVSPQLATLVDDAPTGKLWINETKFDGYRMQAHCVNGATTLYSRNALDWTHKFPDIRDVLNDAFEGRQVVFDGEIVVGEKGAS